MSAREHTVNEGLAEVLKKHQPKDRYNEDGDPVGTFCVGCDWEGDYFADGEAGPFDDHLAAAVLTSDWLAAYVAAERERAETRLAEVEAAHGQALVDLADARDERDRAVREALAPVRALAERWQRHRDTLDEDATTMLNQFRAALPDDREGEA